MNDWSNKEMNKFKLPETYEEAVALIETEGLIFSNINVLKLTDPTGWSVAHYMARRGHKFEDPRILNLRSGRGTRVKTLMRQPQTPVNLQKTA
jgi:hypothetical protein